MEREKFCLKWNDFETNISSAFRYLREDKDFFDVTLVCEDEQVQSHKVILSACSPLFHKVLSRNPHQHPLLFMKASNAQISSLFLTSCTMAKSMLPKKTELIPGCCRRSKSKGLTQNHM
eukprot:TRINITY_DN36717_c0_g1_i1.p1 TRINITY_DN36717_c0_g1~~TRINITY_DN36717_c0_g1_i1.p1  ORF type:complete len:119 (-),score=19.72 TRINITY_DN36717_c0_g1_i1:93-449(-)